MGAKNISQRKRKKNYKLRNFIFYLVFILVFTGVSAPLIIFHGPFTNVKKTIVDAAMTTLSHQWIAKLFLSDAEIQKIRDEDTVQVMQQGNNIKFSNSHDNSIERYNISSGIKFKGYLLIIKDPTRVKVGYSNKLGTQGELTSQIAQDNGSIAAVNAGGFSDSSSKNTKWTGTGGKPTGIIMSNGIVKNDDTENKKVDITAITKDGKLIIGLHSLNELKTLGVTEAVSFGPALVVDNQGMIKSGDGGQGIAPRTAIGQRADGAILLLVIDGRTTKSLGASLKDVQNVMLEYGASNASNLDGGSSTTMYNNGSVINNPCNALGERAVPSAIIVNP
ncbi:phosphodiester glycosidase family protein [Clostridium estertheticum]|uniref:Exopolysaccharide biosynthesis protein n=1 Tax=Clostridium estertheticum TaxID=238834 RepID=A0A5N7IML5_9CLOT|nr:phosphodiester glycosidase family protein [Clostridium estertheticum]MBU3075226.1 phosphodiester glycosidase family protein [Clostridium estertheticum]MBU3165441.1 phosphodiester glycosidase family protein [Clostridium estertheticum]MBU3170460.1 phosphodiester glycosidase family protein [Clostridium estertheticum]MBU3186957.1 phosphodiester glycosidase family protein [Clostridium estertheticum]MCB2340637.1 phosphodiester glycosidase family protein [Clostridium estertheticum]